MNERIKQLAQEAGMYVDVKGEPWPKWMGAEECEVAYKKFAELIVRECIDTMYKRGESYAHPSAGFYQAKTFSEAIMEHFGVEE